LAGIIRFNRQHWARPKNWAKLWGDIRWNRAQQFDWVIDLQCLARSAAFAWLANGKLTIGLDEPREGASGFYDVIVKRASFETHAVDWYLSALQRLGVPVHWNFEWLPPRPDAAKSVRLKWPVETARWVILQPGARWSNKRWPVESFAELVRKFSASTSDFRFAILGGLEDQPLGAAISQAAPKRCLDLTGQVSLSEMLEWIRLSELMVTNDTGPMHAAAALRKPVVALFGPTEPRRTGPYGPTQQCSPAQFALRAVSAAALPLLAATGMFARDLGFACVGARANPVGRIILGFFNGGYGADRPSRKSETRRPKADPLRRRDSAARRNPKSEPVER